VATGVTNRAGDLHRELPPYMAASTLVGVRLWTRRDRSALDLWPRPELPAHWQATETVVGPRISFAIDALPATALVGRITLRDLTEESARIGIYMHPAHCGQGLGSGALLAFQRHMFREGMTHLTLDVAQDNTRAVRAYLRAGWLVAASFQRCGFPYYEMQVRP
jgi:RimJ/RimL family protein N-acetyltransferase